MMITCNESGEGAVVTTLDECIAWAVAHSNLYGQLMTYTARGDEMVAYFRVDQCGDVETLN